jgi:UPF0755 protein
MLILLASCGGKGSGPKQLVRVRPGASFGEITDSLHARGLVGWKPGFKIYARLAGVDGRVKPGVYGFRKGQSWDSMISDLREGRIITIKLVIPEGWSTPGIASRMARVTGVDSTLILARLLADSAPREFGVPGPTLEGYLYPATYEFPLGVQLDSVITRVVGAYRRIWTPTRKARADSAKLSEREVITLASIVEKEAKRREEMPLIASVYRNRLRIGMALQADPTVQYALGTHRQRLMRADIRQVAKHPYNTYQFRGLPPGPIGSPSRMGIDKYLYFVARPDGTHVFTNSLDEHNRAVRQVRLERQRAETAAAGASNVKP